MVCKPVRGATQTGSTNTGLEKGKKHMLELFVAADK